MTDLLINSRIDPWPHQDVRAIEVASLNGHLEIVKSLLQNCTDCLQRLDTGTTSPVHLATEQGHLSVVSYFDHMNASSVDAAGKQQLLYSAALNGHTAMVAYLMQ